LRRFFLRLTSERSLVFFYTKEGHPLGDHIPRLLVGVGTILSVGSLQRYESPVSPSYPFWDRLIRHSIRLDGDRRPASPYHEYLATISDPDETERRRGLLGEIAVTPPSSERRQFPIAPSCSSLTRRSPSSLGVWLVRRVRAHGIVAGDWGAREECSNAQISMAWRDRGAFPGLGSALKRSECDSGLHLRTLSHRATYCSGHRSLAHR